MLKEKWHNSSGIAKDRSNSGKAKHVYVLEMRIMIFLPCE